MEDPAVLIAILKVLLVLVMVIAAVAVGRELVPMARGRIPLRSADEHQEEQ